jgi:hypothetical protein
LDLRKRAASVGAWLGCSAALRRMGLWNRPPELAGLVVSTGCGGRRSDAIAGECGMADIWNSAPDEIAGCPLGADQRQGRLMSVSLTESGSTELGNHEFRGADKYIDLLPSKICSGPGPPSLCRELRLSLRRGGGNPWITSPPACRETLRDENPILLFTTIKSIRARKYR